MRNKAIWRFVLILTLIVTGSPVCTQAHAQTARQSYSPFDRPLRKVAVDLGRSEIYGRNSLTCYYYRSFLVKQLDLGEKGAMWVGIVPVSEGRAAECVQAKDNAEMRVDNKDWSGYFVGMVGGLVFLEDTDGLNGATGFDILAASSGERIFRDEAKRIYRIKNNSLVWEGQHLWIRKSPGGQPLLSYTRAYRADCPLPKSGAACWDKIRAATGLKQPTAPACTGLFKEYPDDPSVIFYPVQVELGPKPVATPVPGPVRCEAQQ